MSIHLKAGTLCTILLSIPLAFHCSGPREGNGAIRFYVGTSDGSQQHSIYLCELDPLKGEFTLLDSFEGASGPSYLTFSPGGGYLYAIDKRISDTATGEMTVSAFRVDSNTDGLTHLNSQPSGGAGPCHVHCSKEGTYLFAANYNSGNIAAFPITEGGAIQPASGVVLSSGTGPVQNRQEGPHTHYVTLDPGEKYLLSPDLGADKVLIYAFDHASGTLTPNPSQPFLKLDPGSGPRHLVFHPSGNFLYVVNELNSTVTACSYNRENGTLTALHSVSTLPDDYEGSGFPAAIRIHPGGKFLYASTRGDVSSIAVFSVDETGGISRIQVVENVPRWPRDFNLDPSGRYLLAAGERSDEIELFSIDPGTGELSRTGARTTLRAPGCILFIN